MVWENYNSQNQREDLKMNRKFKTKEELQKFLDESMVCVCGGLLTGLHEMTCHRIQTLKVMFIGKQDEHPAVRIPKVTD